MKNLFKISGIGFLLFFAITLSAQDYKVKMTSGKVIINKVDKVDIEGHNGTEVIIQGKSRKTKKDDRSAGLRVINGSGNIDNTGLGLSAIKEGDELTIEQISKHSNGRYTIKIPQGVSILYEHDSHEGSKLNVKNIKSEIEITAHFNNVSLENITGPMSINTVHGNIEANFDKVNQANPSTIRSSHGWIDVTLPPDTKANLKLRSSHGDMLTDFDINKNVARNVSGEKNKSKHKNKNHRYNDCNRCDDEMEGGINGGGVLIDLYTAHANIYLRKKK